MLFVGVDIGGTFTDIVTFDEKNPSDIQITKVPTNSKNPEKVVTDVLAPYRKFSKQFALLTHATTAGTNALLTHAGLAKTALITNHGFRDVIEIARQRRPEIYNLKTERPRPLIPRRHRFTVRGRILSKGSVLEAIDRDEIKERARTLEKASFEAVSISLLNSYVNPDHEIETRNILRGAGFKGRIDISSEIDPVYREYERTSTTVVNSSLSRSVSKYLERLERGVRKIGLQCPIYVMNSDGTVNTVAQASKRPISLIESGPAAGALASSTLSRYLGLGKALTLDMGGTTAKAGTIINYQPDLAYEFEAAARTYHGRSIRGSGYPVRQPFIDLAEVSAGGGTIAWQDKTGDLKVGPESAGAVPGPVAYGRGGLQPTVTDANIIAGRIDPTKLLGGNLKLRYDLARAAIKRLSLGLHRSEKATIASILKLVNDSMSKALRLVTIERGRDPREFSLIAFGGAGPLHACDLAEDLEITRIIIPSHPGLFSAFGLLTAQLSRTFSVPILKPVSTNIESYFKAARELARKSLKGEGFRSYNTAEQIDLRYYGQAYEITVPYKGRSNLQRMFAREHRKLYGYSSHDPIEAVNARVRAVIPTPKARLLRRKARTSGRPVPMSSRNVLLEKGYAKIPVYDRTSLSPGVIGKGPCVIEEYDSTTMVGEGWRWKIDEYEDIILQHSTTV